MTRRPLAPLLVRAGRLAASQTGLASWAPVNCVVLPRLLVMATDVTSWRGNTFF